MKYVVGLKGSVGPDLRGTWLYFVGEDYRDTLRNTQVQVHIHGVRGRFVNNITPTFCECPTG